MQKAWRLVLSYSTHLGFRRLKPEMIVLEPSNSKEARILYILERYDARLVGHWEVKLACLELIHKVKPKKTTLKVKQTLI